MTDDQHYFYFALTIEDYKQRFSRTMLLEMGTEFYKAYPEAKTALAEGQSVDPRFLVQVGEKYNVPSNFDKVAQAEKGVDVAKLEVQINLKKMIGNRENLEVHHSHCVESDPSIRRTQSQC